MNWKQLLFGKGKPKPSTIEDYPKTDAEHFGMTFNDWRRANGYKLVDRSVPEIELIDYCTDCGWPTKRAWMEIMGLEGVYLDQLQYPMWLKFIGVLDPDRKPDEATKYINHIKEIAKKNSTLIVLVLCLIGCGTKPEYVHLNKVVTVDTVSTDNFYDLTDEYFEVKLSSVTQATGKYYIAKRENRISDNPFRFEQIVIVGDDKKPCHFTDATSFLNYMAARGYEMVTERKNKYGGEYTFKKK